METINQPSIHGNLVTQCQMLRDRYENTISTPFIEKKRKDKKPEEDTTHACDERNLACSSKAIEEQILRLAG